MSQRTWISMSVLVLLVALLGFLRGDSILAWIRTQGRTVVNTRNDDPRRLFVTTLTSEFRIARGATLVFTPPRGGGDVEVMRISGTGGVWLELPEGLDDWEGVRLQATLGHLTREAVLSAAPGATHTIILPGTVLLGGRVIAKGSGRPLRGVTVACGGKSAETDSEGGFRLGVPPPEATAATPLRLKLRLSGGDSGTMDFGVVSAGEDLVIPFE